MIRPLTIADVPEVGALLARAFRQDPGYSALFPESARESALRFLMERLLRMRLDAGSTVWVKQVGGQVVATITFAPNHVGFGVGTYLRHGLITMPFRFGFGTTRRMLAADEAAGVLRKAHAPHTPYIWFAQIAVDPEHQGRFHGVELTSRALAHVDTLGLPAATMTTRPELARLYGRGGFEVRGEAEFHGFRTWMLVRPQRS